MKQNKPGEAMNMVFTLPDGLYRVTTRYLCAGFVVENRLIVRCAPILRGKIEYWKSIAVKIAD